MQAIIYETFGGPEVLKLAEVEAPLPAAGEVLVDVAAAGVNPFDWKLRRGYFAEMFAFDFPVVAGLDVAGTVRSVGPGVEDFSAGDRVFGWDIGAPVKHGSYAERTVVRASALAKIPNALSSSQAAALPMVSLTAVQALQGLREGDRCLIHGGAGGVGGIAIQQAKRVGAKVYTTASASKLDRVRGLGADVAIDYAAGDFTEAIDEPLDRIVDTRGGNVLRRSYALLKPGGTMVSLVEQDRDGNMFGCRPDGDALVELAAAFAQGQLQIPPIDERPLADAAAAQRDSEAGRAWGKTVLTLR